MNPSGGRQRVSSSSGTGFSSSRDAHSQITRNVAYIWGGLAAVIFLAVAIALASSGRQSPSSADSSTPLEDKAAEESNDIGGNGQPTSSVREVTTTTQAKEIPTSDSGEEMGDAESSVSTTTSVEPIEEPVVNPGWIDTASESAVRAHWAIREVVVAELEWVGSTSSCDAGLTSDGTKQAVLDRVNWFRALAGVSPTVTLDRQKSELAQAAALVMAANYALSHDIDEGWRCFSEAAAEGASNSNLFLGVAGADSIDGYVEDPGASNIDVGHRRWVLSRGLSSIGTGDTYNSNALFVIGENAEFDGVTRRSDGVVSWPPEGYVPVEVVYPRWSISIPEVDPYDIGVEITIDGFTSTPEVYASTGRYGDGGAVVFEPGRVRAGQRVEVKVFVSGRFAFTYEVLPISGS